MRLRTHRALDRLSDARLHALLARVQTILFNHAPPAPPAPASPSRSSTPPRAACSPSIVPSPVPTTPASWCPHTPCSPLDKWCIDIPYVPGDIWDMQLLPRPLHRLFEIEEAKAFALDLHGDAAAQPLRRQQLALLHPRAPQAVVGPAAIGAGERVIVEA